LKGNANLKKESGLKSSFGRTVKLMDKRKLYQF